MTLSLEDDQCLLKSNGQPLLSVKIHSVYGPQEYNGLTNFDNSLLPNRFAAFENDVNFYALYVNCLLYTSPSPRDS